MDRLQNSKNSSFSKGSLRIMSTT